MELRGAEAVEGEGVVFCSGDEGGVGLADGRDEGAVVRVREVVAGMALSPLLQASA